MAEAIRLSINGESRVIAPMTIGALLVQMGLSSEQVAAEVNFVIIPRDAHDTTHLTAGDAVEIVHFIGGG